MTEAKESAFRFQALLADLECTIKTLIPKMAKIEQLSEELGESPKDEIQKMKQVLVDAKQLVDKCSEVACWDFCTRDWYSKKLLQLHAALRWLIEVELPVGQSEDLMRILLEVKRIRHTNNISACFLIPMLYPGRSSDPIDGLPRSGTTKELAVSCLASS